MTSFIQLVFISLLFTSSTAVLKVGMNEYFVEILPEFINITEDGNCSPSFECDIMEHVCARMSEECEVVLLEDLDARIDAVESGDVDFAISLISVTPERSERVHFVRPHYYYAGAQIYVLDTLPKSEHPRWEDLQGKDVCVLKDYYAIEGINFEYKPNLIIHNITVDVVEDNICEYVISDSTDLIPGMVPSNNSMVEFGAPYGIAVSHAVRESLGQRISDALVDMMDDGLDSEILELEKTYLVSYGLSPSKRLTDVVLATTEEGLLPPEVEDAIWDE
eukprot:TRINITY_DN11196_c1_g1_i1.p3 TRINITY_DN11196_c1_g1~~TRINITY_DN11196_c1_g1_i1.p3  ORF type:complete len:277 (+),score=41.10 TRINITY_DN11196_c1_g1_i1:151-981(+)